MSIFHPGTFDPDTCIFHPEMSIFHPGTFDPDTCIFHRRNFHPEFSPGIFTLRCLGIFTPYFTPWEFSPRILHPGNFHPEFSPRIFHPRTFHPGRHRALQEAYQWVNSWDRSLGSPCTHECVLHTDEPTHGHRRTFFIPHKSQFMMAWSHDCQPVARISCWAWQQQWWKQL